MTVNLATGTASVNESNTSDTLIGITNVVGLGNNDTLIGGSGTDTLSASGTGDTLIAGSAISTLINTGSGGSSIISIIMWHAGRGLAVGLTRMSDECRLTLKRKVISGR